MRKLLKKISRKIFVTFLFYNKDILDNYFHNYLNNFLLCTPKFYGEKKNVIISSNSNVNNGLFNSASGKITINDYIFFGHNVSIIAATHDYTKFGTERMETIPKQGLDIVVEEGAWISSNSIVIGPSKIGKHAVILPGSVVTKDVPEFEMWGGVPAKFIKKIALGSKSGKEKIILSENNYGDHRIFTTNETSEIDKYNAGSERKVSEIDIITIDELAKTNKYFDNVNLISIDVQGFELEILKGGNLYFKRGIPMMLEIDPYLLEKKGSKIDVLNKCLSSYYTNYVDLHSKKLEIQNISKFVEFYGNSNSSKKDYSDLLFFKLNNN